MPWYREPAADTITTHADHAAAQVRQAAITALGPRNPLAQRLTVHDRERGREQP